MDIQKKIFLEKKATLEWFLSFLDMDLDALTYGEKVKVLVETGMVTRGAPPKSVSNLMEKFSRATAEPIDWPLQEEGMEDFEPSMDGLKHCQAQLKALLDNLETDLITPILKSKSQGPKTGSPSTLKKKQTRKLTKEQKEQAVELARLRDESIQIFGRLVKGKEFVIQDQIRVEISTLGQRRPEDPLSYIARVIFKASTYPNTFVISFLNVLDGFPVAAIRKCQECGKRFFHASRRGKEFCSNRCAARTVSRARRQRIKEMEPEKYQKENQEGEERAHRSYKTRVHEVHPNAKVERRPRKK